MTAVQQTSRTLEIGIVPQPDAITADPRNAMTVTFSSCDLHAITTAMRTMLAPSLSDLDGWRERCHTALRTALGADSAGYVVLQGEQSSIACTESAVAAATAWQQYYHTVDYGLTQVRRERQLEAFHVLDIYDRAEYARTEFFADWVVPYRMHDTLAVVGEIGSSGETASIHCYFDKPQDDIGARHRAILALVLPAFKAGVTTVARSAQAQRSFEQFIDQKSDGVRLQSMRGHVLHENRALTQIFAEEQDQVTLHECLRQCADAVQSLYRTTTTHHRTAHGAFSRTCQTAAQTYRIRGIALSAAHDPDEQCIALTVTRMRAVLHSDEALRARFGLTAAECAVARLLVLGHPDKEIAAAVGVSWHTARRHAERVLKKVDVHTRSAVAARIFR